MAHRRDEVANVLRQRVVGGLHLGLLKRGSRLPSVRTLAAEFDSDPRVVLAGYRLLELDGLVELRPRSGIFVADSAVSGGEMLPQTSEWVVGVLVQALSRGVPPVDFPDRVRGCLSTVRVTAACIECNDDQIAGLCNELGRDYGLVTTPLDIALLRGVSDPTEVSKVDLLVTTSYHAAEVQHLAESIGKPWIAVSLRPEFVAEATRLLELGPLYFVVSDVRFAEKLPHMFATASGVGRLRVLVVGRDDISAIPPNAPTYVMAAARRQLADLPLLARVIPAPRVFAPESAQALLRFIVSANIAAIRERERAELEGTTAG